MVLGNMFILTSPKTTDDDTKKKVAKQNPKVRAKSILDNLTDTGKLPGIQYIVVDATSIRFQYVGGVLDVASPSGLVQEDSKFLSSSCTKVLTAAAVWKLAEQKKLKFDDSLSKYYSEHPYGNEVTIRHLLNHSSGIPNPMPLNWLHLGNNDDDDDDDNRFDEDKALQQALKENHILQFAPGGRNAYSNISYWLLGKVVEKVSGMSYRQYMKHEIFTPLGISENEISFERSSDTTKYARGHQERFSVLSLAFWILTKKELWDESKGKWARFQQHICMHGPPYGGAIASASGYAKFLQDMLLALQSDGQSSKLFTASAKELLEPQYDNSKSNLLPSTLGGWSRGQMDKYTYYSKPGGGPGFSSNLRIYPDAGIATIYLCNKTEVIPGPIKRFSDVLDREFL